MSTIAPDPIAQTETLKPETDPLVAQANEETEEPGFFEQVRDVVTDGLEQAGDNAGKLWNIGLEGVNGAVESINDVILSPLMEGGKELIDRYLPAPVDEKDGLVPGELSGIYRAPDETRPSADELNGGIYALPGFLDGNGKFRSVISYPTSGRQLAVETKVKEGDVVQKGDILFYEKDPVLEAKVAETKGRLASAKSDLATAVQRAPLEIGQIDVDIAQAKGELAGLEADIAALDQNIASQQVVVTTTEARLEAIRPATAEGAVSERQTETIQNELIAARQLLNTMQAQRARLGAQRDAVQAQVSQSKDRKDAIDTVLSLSPEQIADRARSGDALADLPQSVRSAAQTVIAVETELDGLQAQIENNTVRATLDGSVVTNFPEASKLNRLNGTFELSNSPSQNLGESPQEAERRVPLDGNDGGTISLVPHGDQPVTIQVVGLSEAQNDNFEVGSRVAFQSLTGKMGTARVVRNQFTANGAGYRVYLDDAKFDDGSPMTLADRGTVRVFDTATPTTERPGASSDNVSFEPATPPTAVPNFFRFAEQEVQIQVPVYRRTAMGGTDKIGTVEVAFTVRSDGRVADVKEDSIKATAVSENGAAVNLLPSTSVQDFASGSTVAGSAKADSGQIIRIGVGLTEDNRSFTGGFNANTPLGGIKHRSDLPDATQYQIPIDVVPTGQIDGKDVEISRVVVPRAIIVEENSEDLDI